MPTEGERQQADGGEKALVIFRLLCIGWLTISLCAVSNACETIAIPTYADASKTVMPPLPPPTEESAEASSWGRTPPFTPTPPTAARPS